MNLDNVVKTVDFGVFVPIEINPDNKIISPPIRPFQSVTIFDVSQNCFRPGGSYGITYATSIV